MKIKVKFKKKILPELYHIIQIWKDICTSNVHLPESLVVVVAWEVGAMLAVGAVAVVSVSARVAIVDAIVILVHKIMHAG